MDLSHNPYFNRWFSAIKIGNLKIGDDTCHNPYFNRWFSAILTSDKKKNGLTSHNPYFNRWFSAIYEPEFQYSNYWEVTILILIDGFLQ